MTAPVFGKTPFVARTQELALLESATEEIERGSGALVLIGGEPGVGKTRLTQEFSATATDRGFVSVTGHFYEIEGAPPYVAYVELFDDLVRHDEPELREILAEASSIIFKLSPQLHP